MVMRLMEKRAMTVKVMIGNSWADWEGLPKSVADKKRQSWSTAVDAVTSRWEVPQIKMSPSHLYHSALSHLSSQGTILVPEKHN